MGGLHGPLRPDDRGVSHSAHFGGYAGGMLVALLTPPADQHPGRRRITPGLGWWWPWPTR
ncbi:MAG: hypothetical protein R3F43_16530 [bacterium]